MRVFPAIDILGGQAVRLRQGDYGRRTVYGSPLELAQRYRAAGAECVHIVDLEAARSGAGDPAARLAVERIAGETGMRVQLGGGIRAQGDIERWLDAGVWRLVIGTAAARDPDFARTAAERFGERVIVGIDARDGFVATDGWTRTGTRRAVEMAAQMRAFGYAECVFTDIARDGMLSGPALAPAAALGAQSGLGVIVSGGVRDLDDVRAVAKQAAAGGVTGVILGKSLLEGTLDLRAALAVEGVSET